MFWRKKRGFFGDQLKKHIEAMNSGNISSIAHVFCVFAEKHDPSKLEAARALSKIIDTISFGNIIRIDEQMRRWAWMKWFDFNINSFFTHDMSVFERRAVVIFASFNPSGFIREKAVEMMKNYEGTLPYIILRQNDWVLQVRQAAVSSFQYRLQNLSTDELLAALPFADKLRYCGRGEYTEMSFAVLTSPAHKQDLMEGLRSQNIRMRRICTNALFGTGVYSCQNIKLAFEQLIHEPDPFLCAMIFKRLSALGQRMEVAISLFLNDKCYLKRMLAFQYLLDKNASDIYETAEKLLLDKNAAIRASAQNFIHGKKEGFDFRGFYIANLNKNTASAICGLGERGLPHDADVIEKFLQTSCVGIVKSAMISLMRLDSDRFVSVITEMLDDGRMGVVKTARNLVLKYGLINYEKVKEIFDKSTLEHIKINCASILFSAPKWSRLIYMLEVMANSEGVLKKKAIEAINRWNSGFNNFYTSLPDETQKIKIRRYIEMLDVLPIELQKEILFVLS